jgi:Ni,Fe-hydrogenase III small subunit
MINIFKTGLKKGIVTRHSEVEKLGEELKDLVYRKFKRSFQIREVDTGSCGGCESEIMAATNPIYDIQRFGVDIVASPRHADALLVTGPLSRNMEHALKATYEAMPGPKFVITFGDCALDGGKFADSYYTLGGAKNILPVELHIPGCPPKPDELLRCLVSFLKKI